MNETDLLGRTTHNVTRVRAVFADFDERHDQHPPERWPLPPSIVVRSGGGVHAYWLLDDAPRDRFGAWQRRIAALLGSDTSITDLPRVMRVPGLVHRKHEPVLVQVADARAARRYAPDQVDAAFPDERLAEAARLLAGAWVAGKRHDASLALAGACARAEWPEDEARRFVALVGTLAGAGSDHAADVVDTFAKHAAGQPVTGWGTLARLLGERPVDDARAALGDLALPRTRPVVRVGPDERRVADEALAGLVVRGGVYQRGGSLVTIVHDDRGAAAVGRLTQHTLRERLSDAVTFLHRKTRTGAPRQVPPPREIVAALRDRGTWRDVPVLAGVVDFPVLTPSGRVLATAGYDHETRLWIEPSIEPTEPASVDEAIALLREPLRDFPFANDASVSVVLALLLTVLARPAIDGPTPLFVIDSNAPGVGKGLLVGYAGIVSTGRAPPPTPQASDDEFRKRVLGVLESGATLCAIDDCKDPIGGGTIDRLVTAWPDYEDRRLGDNESRRLPARTVWVATGVNIEVHDHTARRVLACKLQSSLERPEDRDDFAHRDLLAHVHRGRAALLGAALAILRAFVTAGRPAVPLRAFGSFEAWSAIIRGALVHAGLPDPCDGREALASGGGERSAHAMLLGEDGLPALIAAHGEALGDTRGISSAALVEALRGRRFAAVGAADDDRGVFGVAREALETLGADVTSVKSVGYALRKLKDRVVGGRNLDVVTTHRKRRLWVVRDA